MLAAVWQAVSTGLNGTSRFLVTPVGQKQTQLELAPAFMHWVRYPPSEQFHDIEQLTLSPQPLPPEQLGLGIGVGVGTGCGVGGPGVGWVFPLQRWNWARGSEQLDTASASAASQPRLP